MLKDVHGRHEIKGVARETADFEVDVCSRQPAPLQTPLAEAEQGRADVCQGDLEPVTGEEDTPRTYPGTKVQIAPTPLLPSKMQGRNIGKRRGIIAQSV